MIDFIRNFCNLKDFYLVPRQINNLRIICLIRIIYQVMEMIMTAHVQKNISVMKRNKRKSTDTPQLISASMNKIVETINPLRTVDCQLSGESLCRAGRRVRWFGSGRGLFRISLSHLFSLTERKTVRKITREINREPQHTKRVFVIRLIKRDNFGNRSTVVIETDTQSILINGCSLLNPYEKSTGIPHVYRAWTNHTIKARISVLVVWQRVVENRYCIFTVIVRFDASRVATLY